MTKKNARKRNARAHQAEHGGSYQSALRAQGPDNTIRRRHDGLMRLVETALVQCAEAFDLRKSEGVGFEGYPTFDCDITFTFTDGLRIKAHPAHNLKEPVPEDFRPMSFTAAPPFTPLEKRMREVFMVLNSGLGFTGHLAPTREQLMWRINEACRLLADQPDIHVATAEMLGTTREGAKEINAGILYGSSGAIPPGYSITETRDIEYEYAPDGTIRDMKPVPGSERVTVTPNLDFEKFDLLDSDTRERARVNPFKVSDPAEIQGFPWKDAKRCIAPRLRLLGVTDGATTHWVQLTTVKNHRDFMAWWAALSEAEPYARVENDER